MISSQVDGDEEDEYLFENNGKEILGGFFEDRPDELAENLVKNWPKYLQFVNDKEEDFNEARRADKLKALLLITRHHERATLAKFMNRWKNQLLTAKLMEAQEKLLEEREKNSDLRKSNLEFQYALKELRDEALEYRIRLEKELEAKQKKKVAAERRRKMKNQREVSKSLALEKAKMIRPSSPVVSEDPYMSTKERVKPSELENLVGCKSTTRSNYGIDQRGSVNSNKVKQRKQFHSANSRKSCVSASVASGFFSEFSFHPEINRGSKWKPKYDDHHDHEAMLDRMHIESKKIEKKRRLRSIEKDMEEMSACSFTPKINNTNKNANTARFSSSKAASLGTKMYEYADKFKNKLENKKKTIDIERGQEVNFTPRIIETKTLQINRDKGEVYEDLYKDHSRRKKKLQQKVNKQRKTLKNKPKQKKSFVTHLNISELGTTNSTKEIVKQSYVSQVLRKKVRGKPNTKTARKSSFASTLYSVSQGCGEEKENSEFSLNK